MINLFNKINNPQAVTIGLIKELGVKVHATTINDTLVNHPEFPSILAVSDCLNDWHIENNAYQLTNDEFEAEALLFPFIAHLKDGGGYFILVKNIQNDFVHYVDQKQKKANMPLGEFLERWTGVLLHARATAHSGDSNYKAVALKANLASMRLPAMIALVLTIAVITITKAAFPLWLDIAAIIKFIGLSVSVLLLMSSIDANNPFIQNLCSMGKKNDCNAILKSDAAKLTPWLSWSEVGFFYYAGSLLALVVLPVALPLIALLNILSLPYSFYSIGYQYRAKNWCVLCCSVQGLLWLEAIAFLCAGVYNAQLLQAIIGLSLSQIALVILIFVTPIVIWSFIKPYLLGESQVEPLKEQLKKFKYNTELFNQILTAQPRYAIPQNIMPIVLGNPLAETIITMVSNPFCGPCASAHAVLDSWLSSRDDLQLKLVFTSNDHDDDPKTKVARHLTALSRLEDRKVVEQALNDWYNSSAKNYESWSEKYPVNIDMEIEEVISNQKQWCEVAEVTFTPTIFINGYKLPVPYRLEDVKYLLN